MHQRNGDLVGAISFMKAVLAKQPNTRFEWVVKRDISGYERDIEALKQSELGDLAGSVNLTVIDSADYKNAVIVDGQIKNKKTGKVLSAQDLTDRKRYGASFIE